MYDDDKWPLLTVAGPAITPAQAEQVLIRTDRLYLDCGDREWTNAAHEIIIGVPDPWSLHTHEERIAALKAQMAAKHRLGLLELQYLGQSRIANGAKGSPGGWLDWDGTIGARPYNIGLWPAVEDVTADWGEIAQAFPFLEVRSQVASLDHDDRLPPRPWGTWTIAGGAASFDPGAIDPLEVPDPAPHPAGWQCLGLDELRGIVERVRAVTPEREPEPRRIRPEAARR